MHFIKGLFYCGYLLLFSSNSFAQDPKDRLTILNWSDYLAPDIVAEFEAKYDAEVTQIYYETDEQRTQMLVDNNAAGYDLILSSGIDLAPYANRGWISPLNKEQLPNLGNLSSRWLKAYSHSMDYAVPYFWGTVGIIYRTDLVQQPITSWMRIFQPNDELKGHIGMIADGRDMLSLGLKALGYSINSGAKQELEQVELLLLNQKQHVRSYQYMNLDETSEIITGDLWASMIYSGDALMVMEHSDLLEYVVPDEGSNIWVDYFVVGAMSSNKKLAHQFLNFINEPEVAARMAEFTYYATPNFQAEKLLPKEFVSDPVIYPSEEVLVKSEFYQPIPARQLLRRNNVSSKVLSEIYAPKL